jgi:hypothetical protein
VDDVPSGPNLDSTPLCELKKISRKLACASISIVEHRFYDRLHRPQCYGEIENNKNDLNLSYALFHS